jgi:hypothetical protein
MRPLVAVRRATAFDPNFLSRSPLFWPVVRAATALGRLDDFPSVKALDGVFEGDPPVRFAPWFPPRKRRAPIDVRCLYDGRIAVDGVVPTRERCWHDLMNALVWGTFPRAKRAVHGRQHRANVRRVPVDATTLPPVRSSELDALALVDEGGVVVLARDPTVATRLLASRARGALRALTMSNEAEALIFGHAIYESLALGTRPAVAAAVVIDRGDPQINATTIADVGLAKAIDDDARFQSPRELVRVDLSDIPTRVAER